MGVQEKLEVAGATDRFDLIETMRFEAVDGFIELERHLDRMKASARELGFAFNRHDCRNDLQAATFRLTHDARIRLMLAKSGAVAIEVRAIPEKPVGPVEVAVVPLPIAPDDLRLRHKTSDRAFLEDARRAAGTFEVLFIGPDGRVTEGSFTSLFVPRDGRLLTPRAGSLMPGVLRERLIETGEAYEGDVRMGDLAGEFFVGNSLRGLIPAKLVAAVRN
jgi:4-amino-4-deoxychorismate lyase